MWNYKAVEISELGKFADPEKAGLPVKTLFSEGNFDHDIFII